MSPSISSKPHRPAACCSALREDAGWPCCRGRRKAPSASAHKARVVAINRADLNAAYCSNKVSNTRYSVLSFLPVNMADQFSSPMNLYFLLIACLQLWRTITPVNPVTTWAPLIFVFAISAIKEAVDDLRRYRADVAANARPYTVYRCGVEQRGCPSEDIRVGDLVQLFDDEEVPCDLLLLQTGGGAVNDGVAFIETANLDGETDLKTRRACAESHGLTHADTIALRGRLECETPNAELYRFDAKLSLSGVAGAAAAAAVTHAHSFSQHVSITAEQLVQHGTLIRKTGWILGMAVYTGKDTKMNQNRAPPPSKAAAVNATINRFSVAIFAVQLIVVVVFGLAGHAWSGNGNPAVWYLGWPTSHAAAMASGDSEADAYFHDAAGGGRRREATAVALGAASSFAVDASDSSGRHSSGGGGGAGNDFIDPASLYPAVKGGADGDDVSNRAVGNRRRRLAASIILSSAANTSSHVADGDNTVSILSSAASNSSSVADVNGTALSASLRSSKRSIFNVSTGSTASEAVPPASAAVPPAAAAAAAAVASGRGVGGRSLASTSSSSSRLGGDGGGGGGGSSVTSGLLRRPPPNFNLRSAAAAAAAAAAAVTDPSAVDGDVGVTFSAADLAATSVFDGTAAAGESAAPRRQSDATDGAPSSDGTSSTSSSSSSSKAEPSPHSDDGHAWYTPLVLPLRFLLLSSMMIPISLKVTLDLVKLYFARLIATDWYLGGAEEDAAIATAAIAAAAAAASSSSSAYSSSLMRSSKHQLGDGGVDDDRTPSQSSSSSGGSLCGCRGRHGRSSSWWSTARTYTVVSNTGISEDLGHVDVILTDKTGTLTENVMSLSAVSIGGTLYGAAHLLSEHTVNPEVDLDLVHREGSRPPESPASSSSSSPFSSDDDGAGEEGEGGDRGHEHESSDDGTIVYNNSGAGVNNNSSTGFNISIGGTRSAAFTNEPQRRQRRRRLNPIDVAPAPTTLIPPPPAAAAAATSAQTSTSSTDHELSDPALLRALLQPAPPSSSSASSLFATPTPAPSTSTSAVAMMWRHPPTSTSSLGGAPSSLELDFVRVLALCNSVVPEQVNAVLVDSSPSDTDSASAASSSGTLSSKLSPAVAAAIASLSVLRGWGWGGGASSNFNLSSGGGGGASNSAPPSASDSNSSSSAYRAARAGSAPSGSADSSNSSSSTGGGMLHAMGRLVSRRLQGNNSNSNSSSIGSFSGSPGSGGRGARRRQSLTIRYEIVPTTTDAPTTSTSNGEMPCTDELQLPAAPSRRCIQYASASPDEEALVHAAARLGVALGSRRVISGGRQRLSLVLDPRKVAAAAATTTPVRVGPRAEGGARELLTAASSTHTPQIPTAHISTSPAAAPGGGDGDASGAPLQGKRVWVCDAHPTETYEVLHVLEFSSERKRMSVVVRRVKSPPHPHTQVEVGSANFSLDESSPLMLLCKGADDVIMPRLAVGHVNVSEGQGQSRSQVEVVHSSSPPHSSLQSYSQGTNTNSNRITGSDARAPAAADAAYAAGIVHSTSSADAAGPSPPFPTSTSVLSSTLSHLEICASRGLRTLVVASRVISPSEYEEWKGQWAAAHAEIGPARVHAVSAAADALERDLHLLGATAIEDRLQEGVPGAIADLRKAGVSFWMLTGDKYSTALQIGRAARLISSSSGSVRTRDAVEVGAPGSDADAGLDDGDSSSISSSIDHDETPLGAADHTFTEQQQQQQQRQRRLHRHRHHAVQRAQQSRRRNVQHSSSNSSSSSSSSSAIGSSDRESSAPSAAGGHNANKTTASSAASDQHAYLVSRTTPPQRSDAPLLLSLRGHSFAVVEEELCAAYRLVLSAHEQQLQFRARSSWHTSTAAAVVSRGATRGGGSSSDNFNSISGVGGVGGEYRGASPASSNFNLASVSAFACGGALFATRAIASLLPLSVTSRARVALLLARRGWRRLATTTTASTYRPLTPASSSSSSSAVSASPGASPPIAASPSADKATVTIGTPSSSSGSGGGTSSSSSGSGGLVASMSRLFASLLRLLEPTSSDGDSAAPLLPAVPSAVLVVEGHALRHLLGHGSSSSMPHTDSTFNVWGAPHTNSAAATASASAASGAAHTPSGRMIALPDGSLLTPSAAFLSLALSCGTVICCRCSPAQKASLVTLVRSRGLTTLAIGDGGNDVAMIQAADVGVGIAGREGQQAARAADFSFSRFRFLRRLLLVHGRRSYYRTSLVSQYTFYKSQLICFVQLLFNARCAFSGCSLLDTLSLTGYNMVYTALAGTLLVLDTDEEEAVIEADPTLYRASAARTWITPTTFVAWAARAFTQALIVFILCCGIADGGLIDGASLDQATLSYVAYSSVIVLQMLTLVTEMRRPTALNHAVNAGSLTIYAAQILIRNSWPVSSSSAGTASAILASPGLQLAILLAVVAMALPPWIGHAWGLIDRAQSANSRSSSGKAEVNASRRGSDSPSPRPSSSPSSHVSVRQGSSRNASSLHTSATAAAAAAASAVGWKQRLAIFNRVPSPSSASPSRRWWSDILGAEAAAAAAAATTVSGEEEGDKEQQQQLQHQHVRRKRRAVHGRHEHQHRHQQRYADDTARSGSSRGTTSGNSGNSSGGPNSSFLPAAVSAPTRSGASASSAGTRTYASLPASALSSSLDSVGGDGRLTRGDYHQLQLSQVATRGDTGGQLQLGGVSSSLPAVPVTPPPPQQPFSQFTHKSAAAAAARSRSNDGASIISGNSSGGGSNSSTGSIIGRIGAALRWGLNSTTTSMPPSSTGSSTGSGHGAVAVALAQDSDDDRTPGTQSKDPRFKVRPGGGAKEV